MAKAIGVRAERLSVVADATDGLLAIGLDTQRGQQVAVAITPVQAEGLILDLLRALQHFPAGSPRPELPALAEAIRPTAVLTGGEQPQGAVVVVQIGPVRLPLALPPGEPPP